MGQTQTTPLSIMVDHSKEVKGRASNLSAEVRKGWWQTFCSREWPTFNVRWPPEGTFDLPTIRRVRDVVSQPMEVHPDQLSYIVTWQDLVEDPPSWLRPFLPPCPPGPKPIPAGLIDLLDSVLFTHQPTWDDCQILFTTEERERILNEAWKVVPGMDGNPTTNQAQVDVSFPLTWPEWDFNTAEGKERLRVYRQTLMGGLRMAARKPTNLAKVGNVQQERDESPAAFLGRIMEAYHTYTPMSPEAPENKAAAIISFVNQLATDIRVLSWNLFTNVQNKTPRLNIS
uniref:Core shell protein Gag P30 domain-containing protein n=1 Tax=Myotis myotis TaxID=51298 RepID=A0A7J7VIB2_MYOMY|nr:hypothetical protein mMyoMyo1_008227 [Myotis myotis]